MRRVYVEPLRPPFSVEGKERHEAIQGRMREAVDRVLERAALEFTSPVRAVSVSMSPIDTNQHGVVVLVEDDTTGFRPLGA